MASLITPPSSQSCQKIESNDDDEYNIRMKKEILPITPPNERTLELNEKKHNAKKSSATNYKRKPKLRYRPPNGTVLNISTFNKDIPIIDQDDNMDYEDVSFLHHAFKYSKRMIVVTGAGISVASGIPDFRSSNGLFQGLKKSTSSGTTGKALFDSNLYRDSESTAKFHAMINQLYKMTKETEPTEFHKLVNNISGEGRLLRLYTQNIDCLETELPHLQTTVPVTLKPPYPPTIQLHGTIRHMYCTKCRWNAKIQPEIFEGTEPPICPECIELDEIRRISGKRSQGVGFLRPRIVLYNEFHPDGEHIGQISTHDLKSKPDCLVIAGTSLKIPGVRILVKELARAVHAAKGCVIWVNTDTPSMSIIDYIEYIDLIVVGDCQDVGNIVESYDRSIKKKPRSRKAVKVENHTKVEKVASTVKISKKNSMIQTSLEELITKINESKKFADV